MIMFSAIIYTLSVIMLSMISMSYLVALKMTPRLHILALLLFFLTVLLIAVTTVIKLWGIVLFGHHTTISTSEFRGVFLLASSSLLLYTTWKKN